MTKTKIDQQLLIKRPCLAISDLERSLQVYQDILGFKIDYQSEASADSYLYSLFKFPPQAKLKFVSLSTETELRALALTEVKGIELPAPTPPYRTAMVIRVTDIEETINEIRQLNLEVIPPNHFQTPPNLNFTEQAFWDFDGHLTMLYQVRSRSRSRVR